MKFYKLNNTWVSWDELHNGYGYTLGSSIAVTYKSAHNGSSWGEDAGSGYYVGDIDDMVHGSFWCDSDYGWFDLNGLVWNPEIYPSNATPLMMQNGGITSPAVSLESDGVTYYLIKVIVADTGWITADEAAELGWEVYDEMQGTFIVFDTVENKIVSAFTNELTYGEIEGIVLQSPKLVYGVDISVPTAQFWFSANGRNETVNRALNTGNPLYTEDGVRLLPSTHSDYIGAVPLSFMEVDGDMFMADSDPENNYIRIVNDYLNLYIKPGIPIRDESAWAVQFERVFTLSFVNTQLPDITITLPSDETGHKGTSITLPTMSGEYESGGKTWTPSAWDIGAFGDSYTLNADTVANLIFEEVQQYQEITLYTVSGNKKADSGNTSSFSGNVRSEYCYQLYKDAACTIPWKEYDYSNEYELGRYIGGVWQRLARQSISELPATTTGNYDYVTARILLDTGELWYASNYVLEATVANISPIAVRIYPKEQQYYAAYFNQTDTYGNWSVLSWSTREGVSRPNTGGQYIQTPSKFPAITLQKVLGSAGNEITGDLSVNQGANFSRFTLNNNTGALISIRVALYTLEYPTFYHWLESDGTDIPTSSGVAYPVMNLGGEVIEIDDNYDYFPIGLIQYNGNWATSTQTYLNNATMGAFDPDHPTWLCFKQVSGTLSMSCVWYYKKPKSQ